MSLLLFFSCQSCQTFVTPSTAAFKASLSFAISRSLLKLMSIVSVRPSNYLILCCPLFLPPSIFPSIRVFSHESVLCIRWPKYWSFSFSISPSSEYSGPITAWQIKGEKVEGVTGFLFLGSKITADGNCSHEIKICLLLGRKTVTNLDSILQKQRC